MKKRKVLFITPSLCQGGIEHYQITMLRSLDKDKYDVTLYLYLEDVTLLPLVPEYVRVIVDKDNSHYYRRGKALALYFQKKISAVLGLKEAYNKYAEKLRQFIHTERAKHPARDVFAQETFDVVVSNAIGISTEIAQYILASKRYVFFHSSVDMHHEMLEKVFPNYDGIIAVSSGVKEMLQKAYPAVRDKVILLENYVDAKVILEKADSENIDCLAEKNEDIKIIGSCGRLSSEKGFDLAVEAVAILKKRGYVFKWYFIGDGPERERLEGMIKKHLLEDMVCITGFMDNPFPLMRDCDIYVQPSYEESYGRTIKEAMILGCPVVSTDTVGGNTLIKNGQNGILTEINAEALANGIAMLLTNKELLMKYSESYSIEHNVYEQKVFKDGLEKILSE